MKTKNIIVYVYNSFNDPLFKGNLFLIIKSAADIERFNFHIITYEQEYYKIEEAKRKEIKVELKKHGINWYPLTWHSGQFKLFKKVFDLLIGAIRIIQLRIFSQAEWIISLGTISGSFSFLFSRLLRLKHYGYQYEPHSEFLRDFGIWSGDDVSFKLLNMLEKKYGVESSIISTGTEFMLHRLQMWETKAELFKLPSCVNEEKFKFSIDGRSRIRKKYQIGQKQNVILYLGKFGGIYYSKEIIDLFWYLFNLNSTFFFLIVTTDPPESIQKLIDKYEFPKNSYKITKSSYEEVQDYISASDLGVVAIPSYPSQKYRSPIKVGEYLCTGLPYIVCKGISEDDIIAEKYNVGIVLDEFTELQVLSKWGKIKEYLCENKDKLRQRCTEAGIFYRGLSSHTSVIRQIFDRIYSS